MMKKKISRIFVAGHKGLVGSAILNKLKKENYKKIIFEDKKNLDLRNQSQVFDFFKKKKIDYVINAAAKVGGIYANNKYRADYIYENLLIQNNIIGASQKFKIKGLIFLGSSCIYPRLSDQPIKESYLLNGTLEPTNEPYAVAKIAGIKLCESFNNQYKTNFKCLMPSNIYGPNDNFNLQTSHFLPALIRKISEAKKKKLKNINIWGTGKPKRELLFSDDLADACIFFLKKKTKHSLINIGTDDEYSITEYAKEIFKLANFFPKIDYDKSKPDGMYRKKLDTSIANSYGWKPKTKLSEGLEITFDFYEKTKNIRGV